MNNTLLEVLTSRFHDLCVVDEIGPANTNGIASDSVIGTRLTKEIVEFIMQSINRLLGQLSSIA